jgi:hypothetical protein
MKNRTKKIEREGSPLVSELSGISGEVASALHYSELRGETLPIRGWGSQRQRGSFMNSWKHLYWVPVYISTAAMMSACGLTSSTSFGSSASTTAATSSTSGTSGTSTSGSTTSSDPAALSFANISMTGAGGTNPTYSTLKASGAYIQTDDTLKVRVLVEPGTSGLSISTYSGFSANYNCVSYEVSIYDDSGALIGSQDTGMLQVTGSSECMNSSGTNYQDLDFSGSVTGPHGGLNVEVQALSYDWYCQLWYDYYDMYGSYSPYYSYYSYWCPSKAVYKTHTIDASIQVETNGTQLTLTN